MNEFEYWRDQKHWHGGHRAHRGDLRPKILICLLDKPMHGYEIISTLEEETHGFWRPSAGSIYPNLQLLEEQDLVTSVDKDGKKIYTLTEKGKVEANAAKAERSDHDSDEKSHHGKEFHVFKMSFIETMMLLRQIASQDDEAIKTEANKILFEAKDKLAKLVKDK